MNILERPDGSGIFDIWDIVGVDNYSVPEFYAEGAHHGFSRLIPKQDMQNENFSKLKPGLSLHIYLSAHGHLDNPTDLWLREKVEGTGPDNLKSCPQGIGGHTLAIKGAIAEPAPMCVSLLWACLKGSKEWHRYRFPEDEKEQISFSWWGRGKPKDFKPKWKMAAFLALPLQRVEVIKDHAGDETHEKTMKILEKNSPLPFELVEE